MIDIFMELFRSWQFLAVTGAMILIIPAIFYLSSLSRKPVKVERKPARVKAAKPVKRDVEEEEENEDYETE